MCVLLISILHYKKSDRSYSLSPFVNNNNAAALQYFTHAQDQTNKELVRMYKDFAFIYQQNTLFEQRYCYPIPCNLAYTLIIPCSVSVSVLHYPVSWFGRSRVLKICLLFSNCKCLLQNMCHYFCYTLYVCLCTQWLISPVGWDGMFYDYTNDYTVRGRPAGYYNNDLNLNLNLFSAEVWKLAKYRHIKSTVEDRENSAHVHFLNVYQCPNTTSSNGFNDTAISKL